MTAVELAAHPAGASRARPNGWWGMAIFAAAEAMLVATIVGSYFYLWLNTRTWPPAGIPEPALVAPVLITALLLAALVPIHAAAALGRQERRGAALGALALATSMQAGYLAVQVHLFTHDLARFTPQSGAYASIYYVLLGAADAHVVVGLLLDTWLLARIGSRLTPYRLVALQATAFYWYLVGAIAVIALLTEISPRL